MSVGAPGGAPTHPLARQAPTANSVARERSGADCCLGTGPETSASKGHSPSGLPVVAARWRQRMWRTTAAVVVVLTLASCASGGGGEHVPDSSRTSPSPASTVQAVAAALAFASHSDPEVG